MPPASPNLKSKYPPAEPGELLMGFSAGVLVLLVGLVQELVAIQRARL